MRKILFVFIFIFLSCASSKKNESKYPTSYTFFIFANLEKSNCELENKEQFLLTQKNLKNASDDMFFTTYSFYSKNKESISISLNGTESYNLQSTNSDAYDYLLKEAKFEKVSKDSSHGKILIYNLQGHFFKLSKSEIDGTMNYVVSSYCTFDINDDYKIYYSSYL